MLAAEQLTLWRGYRCLFEALDVAVGPGEALLVRGPNGSGKTTLLRVLCGLTRPESGRVRWQGRSIESCRGDYGRALAYFGHQTGLKSDLTTRQNLLFAASLSGAPASACDTVLGELGIADCAHLQLRYLSAGQQRRTALARILIARAQLWIMDEPFTNLDVGGRDYVEQRLQAHLGDGGLMVLSAHHDLRGQAAYRVLELGGSV